MKMRRVNALQWTVALIVATALIVGCNSGSGSPFASPQTGAAQSHRFRSLTDESATVQVINKENETIVGSLVTPAPCWTISPSPVPTVSASPGVSPIITETYNATCTVANSNTVVLQYSFGDGYAICDFYTTWSASGFSYNALGNQGNCRNQTPSSGAAVDQDFIFGIILDDRHRHRHQH
jgi:hypothetical protein